jgi:hypothetical protein
MRPDECRQLRLEAGEHGDGPLGLAFEASRAMGHDAVGEAFPKGPAWLKFLQAALEYLDQLRELSLNLLTSVCRRCERQGAGDKVFENGVLEYLFAMDSRDKIVQLVTAATVATRCHVCWLVRPKQGQRCCCQASPADQLDGTTLLSHRDTPEGRASATYLSSGAPPVSQHGKPTISMRATRLSCRGLKCPT